MMCYKALRKTQADLNKWKSLPCSWIGSLHIIKVSIFPKLTYKFNASPIKMPMGLFIKLEKVVLKCLWKSKEPRITPQKKRNKIFFLYKIL